jgi:hypothetical protein
MKYRTVKVFAITFFLAFIYSLSFCQNWTLRKDSEGIKVYTRNNPTSDFDEAKSEMVVDSRIEVVAEVLRDIESFPGWMYGCLKTSFVEKKDRSNFTFYFVFNSPWPVSDRDVTVKVATTFDLQVGKATIKLESVNHPSRPENSDYVRMRELKGEYTLEYLSRNKTKVTYWVKIDPGGSIPASLANLTSVDLPFETLNGLRAKTTDQKYLKLAEKSEDRKLVEQSIKDGYLKE